MLWLAAAKIDGEIDINLKEIDFSKFFKIPPSVVKFQEIIPFHYLNNEKYSKENYATTMQFHLKLLIDSEQFCTKTEWYNTKGSHLRTELKKLCNIMEVTNWFYPYQLEVTTIFFIIFDYYY